MHDDGLIEFLGTHRNAVLATTRKDGRPQSESFAKDAGVTFPSAFDAQGNLMTHLGLKQYPEARADYAGGWSRVVSPGRSSLPGRAIHSSHAGWRSTIRATGSMGPTSRGRLVRPPPTAASECW